MLLTKCYTGNRQVVQIQLIRSPVKCDFKIVLITLIPQFSTIFVENFEKKRAFCAKTGLNHSSPISTIFQIVSSFMKCCRKLNKYVLLYKLYKNYTKQRVKSEYLFSLSTFSDDVTLKTGSRQSKLALCTFYMHMVL